MLSDIEIAQSAELKPIAEIANQLGISADELEFYGKYKAKLSDELADRVKDNPDGKLILVTAINPTPAGEGKTTTSAGLGQAMAKIGKKAIIALREPSLGPVFGIKGGAAGGGVFCAVFRRQGDLSAHDADDDRRLQGLRRLSAHRNGLPHRQDAGLPRGGHDPGDGARDAAERPMDKLHRAASLSAWKKAPLPKKAAVLAFLRYVNYNETDH